MKAAIYDRFGSPEVVKIAEVTKPNPGPEEVLIRIRASSLTTADWRARSLIMPRGFGPFAKLIFGFSRPRQPILGTELSGVVEAIGANVLKFKVGDAVVAATGAGYGCHAEYRCLQQSKLIAKKPDTLSFEEAAVWSFGALTAYDFLILRAQLKKGERVLVNGASGSVGLAAVQVAKHFGADVTAVCSAANADFVKSHGASRVVDYREADVTNDPYQYDVVFDTVGNLSYENMRARLRENGRLLLIAADMPQILGALLFSKRGQHKVFAGPASESRETFETVLELVGSGALKPVIDREFNLEDIVQAHVHVDARHRRGNVAIKIK